MWYRYPSHRTFRTGISTVVYNRSLSVQRMGLVRCQIDITAPNGHTKPAKWPLEFHSRYQFLFQFFSFSFSPSQTFSSFLLFLSPSLLPSFLLSLFLLAFGCLIGSPGRYPGLQQTTKKLGDFPCNPLAHISSGKPRLWKSLMGAIAGWHRPAHSKADFSLSFREVILKEIPV